MEWKLPGKSFRKYGYTSQGCPHAEVKKKKQAKQKPVASRGLHAWGFLWWDFFQFANENNTWHSPVLSHAISRYVCFGGKRSNGTDSSITFLFLVVKISLLVATLCFGVIYLTTNNYTFTKRTSSPVPWFWKIGTRQILPSLPWQERDLLFSKWLLRQICRSFTVLRNLWPF